MLRRYFTQLIGLILCTAIAISSIFYFNSQNGSEEAVPEHSQDLYNDLMGSQDDNPNIESNEYDPLSELTSNPTKAEEDLSHIIEYKYEEEIAKFNTVSELSSKGYKLSSKVYDPADTALAIVSSSSSFAKAYSQKKQAAEIVVTEQGQKGGTVSRTEKSTADAPLLLPYYGYIIHTADGKRQLLDSKGNVLVYSFSGYTPVYRTTLSGEPLFKYDGKYYYYCDPKSTKELFFDKIEADTYSSLPSEEPTAAQYFNYDYYIILNKYYMDEAKRSIEMTDISVMTPDKPGMVEYLVNEDTVNSLTIPAYSHTSNKADLYPFYSYQYTPELEVEKILWGYMDSKGNVKIEPKFLAAYSFSDEGYAVAVNLNSHLCIIDTKGNEVYNPYDEPVYLPELGGGYARSIFYLPDTYGIENTGMFTLSCGYTRMRRKLVDTTQGNSLESYGVKNEAQIVVSYDGSTVNYPADYNLISYSDGILLLEKNGKYGYMNTDSKWLVKPVMSYARPFSEGLGVMAYTDGKVGVIDTEGNIIIPHIFTNIEDCSGGVITAFSAENGWVIFNKMTTKAEAEFTSPVLALKTRALAKAKFDYYAMQEQKKETEQ